MSGRISRALEAATAWIRRVTGREQFEGAMEDELAFHIEAHADELEKRGVPRAGALRQARLKFGSSERYKQEGREISPYRLMDELHADLRDAIRGLNRDRSFAMVATAVIASVLAVNMVLFAFLDSYFIRPLPIEGASRHVELAARREGGRMQRLWPLADVEKIIASDSPVIESGYAFAVRRVIVGGRDPKRAYVEVVSPSYFALVHPLIAMGRSLSADTHQPPEPAILLSHTGWTHLLGSDPNAVGRTLLVDGASLTVAGVLREGAGGLEPVTPEFWMLAGAADPNMPSQAAEYMVGALLREGVSEQTASVALLPLLKSIELGSSNQTSLDPPIREAVVEPRTTLLRESRDLQPLAIALLFLFGLVTAIAAANLTSLHLARATARRHDLSIRAALGASRGRLVRHLLTEGILISLVAAVIAWGVAVGSVALVQGEVFSIVTDAGMSMLPVAIDALIVGYAFVLALAVGLGCGLLPALQTTKMQQTVVLKKEGSWLAGTLTAGRLRGGLVVLQVAMSLPLLISAGVLVKSALQASQADVGYRLDGLIDLRASALPPSLETRIRALPGVAAASVVAQTPLGGDMSRTTMRYDGNESVLSTNQIDEHFFGVMGIAVTEGRNFYPQEAANRSPVAVVSEMTAKRLWPGRNPLGRTIDIEDTEAVGVYHPYEVVGVSADVISGFFFRGPDPSVVYRAANAKSAGLTDLVVRLNEENKASFDALRAACIDAGSFCEPTTLRKMLGYQRVPFAVASLIASSLGLLALGLACLGLHGLVRFAVVQRTREFGVRLALGSTRGQILRNVLGESLRRVGWGLGLGLPACLALSALIASRVRILESFDPVSYSVVPLLLLAAAVLASLLPAIRAASVDPIKALRDE